MQSFQLHWKPLPDLAVPRSDGTDAIEVAPAANEPSGSSKRRPRPTPPQEFPCGRRVGRPRTRRALPLLIIELQVERQRIPRPRAVVSTQNGTVAQPHLQQSLPSNADPRIQFPDFAPQ